MSLLRKPVPTIKKTEGGYTVNVDVGERSILGDAKRYRDDSEFKRNAAIAAVAALVSGVAFAAALRNPNTLKYIAEGNKHVSALEQAASSIGPTLLGLGALGLANDTSNKTDSTNSVMMLGAGAAATALSLKGVKSAPTSLKVLGLASPFLGAGLNYSARRAERLEKRDNTLTDILPAARYFASHDLLAKYEKAHK